MPAYSVPFASTPSAWTVDDGGKSGRDRGDWGAGVPCRAAAHADHEIAGHDGRGRRESARIREQSPGPRGALRDAETRSPQGGAVRRETEGKMSPPGRVSARHVPSAPRFHTFSPSAAYTASATAIDDMVRAESPSRVHVPASRRHTPRGVAAQSVAPLPASAIASAPGSEFTGTETRPALTGRAARETVSSAPDMARAGKPRTSESRLMWRASGAGSAFFAVYMARHVRNTRWGWNFQKEKS